MSADRRRRITLVTSNGWGLGHLSREIAIALAIGDRADVTMFSFSRGLPLLSQFGLRGEFCPGYTSPWIPRERWNAYVQQRFEDFLTEVDPDVVLFDGVAPYPGILSALVRRPDLSAGWLRRGMWLHGRTEWQLAKSSAFDFVIEPGDLAGVADTGPTSRLDSIRVPPVSLLEVVPPLSREEAAASLGLDPSRPALLFGLAAGQPGDAVHAGRVALDQAIQHEGWQVGVVTSPLASNPPVRGLEGIQLRGIYPLARYLAAFDAAVSAAGYNSVHELLPSCIPTLLVPKSASQTDDQIARAAFLADRGLALAASDEDVAVVAQQVSNLMDGDRASIRNALEKVDIGAATGGARAVADLLVAGTLTGVRRTDVDEWRQPGFKGWVKRAVGPSGVEFVRRVLGRVADVPPRYAVSLDPEPPPGTVHLLVTDDPSDVRRASDQPVEHMLPQASSGYRAARERLIDRYYEVTS